MRRPTAAIAIAFAAVLAAPSVAFAAQTQVSVSITAASLVVRAQGSETNQVVIYVDAPAAPTALLVYDAGPGITTKDPTCSAPAPGVVSCPIGKITKLDVATGDRNDSIAIGPGVPAKLKAAFNGGSGNDSVFGGVGDDTLAGSSNNDTLIGGEGNDKVNGGSSNDSLSGGPGQDDLNGDQNSDYLDGGPDPDVMRGGSGIDAVSYLTRSVGVSATIGGTGGNAEDGSGDTIGSDVENLFGTLELDVLSGDRDSNVLVGGPGTDYLLGLAGNDRLFGQDGDDFLFGDVGDDILKGGFGADSHFAGPDNDKVRARDGARDAQIRCGPGFDRAKRDRGVDPRGRSCELPRRHRRRR